MKCQISIFHIRNWPTKNSDSEHSENIWWGKSVELLYCIMWNMAWVWAVVGGPASAQIKLFAFLLLWYKIPISSGEATSVLSGDTSTSLHPASKQDRALPYYSLLWKGFKKLIISTNLCSLKTQVVLWIYIYCKFVSSHSDWEVILNQSFIDIFHHSRWVTKMLLSLVHFESLKSFDNSFDIVIWSFEVLAEHKLNW